MEIVSGDPTAKVRELKTRRVIWVSIWPAVPSWRRHYCPRSTNSSSSSTRSSPEPGFRCSPQDSTPGFELVDTQPLNSGVVILTYARARSRPPGSRSNFQRVFSRSRRRRTMIARLATGKLG